MMSELCEGPEAVDIIVFSKLQIKDLYVRQALQPIQISKVN